MFIQGRIVVGVFTLIISAFILFFAYTSTRGKVWGIRKMPQIDSIDDMIGRCTELGRSVHISCGIGGLTSTLAPQTIAALSILRYVATKTAKMKTRLICTTSMADHVPLLNDIIKTVYQNENALDQLAPDTIRYFGSAETLGVCTILGREKCGASFLVGAWTSGAVTIMETASVNDCITLFGNARTGSYYVFPFANDTLIGEELFTAGAYLSKDSIQIGTILGQDGGKVIGIIVLILGIIMRLMGGDITQLLLR
jgi:hypothetical protein